MRQKWQFLEKVYLLLNFLAFTALECPQVILLFKHPQPAWSQALNSSSSWVTTNEGEVSEGLSILLLLDFNEPLILIVHRKLFKRLLILRSFF